MDIINVERINQFARRHPRSASSLRRWEAIVRESSWRNLSDLRNTFNTADYVSGKIVFNIGGNNFRLIAVVDFDGQRVIVRNVLTHAEYDRGAWQ